MESPDCECWIYQQMKPKSGSRLDWEILHCYDRKSHCKNTEERMPNALENASGQTGELYALIEEGKGSLVAIKGYIEQNKRAIEEIGSDSSQMDAALAKCTDIGTSLRTTGLLIGELSALLGLAGGWGQYLNQPPGTKSNKPVGHNRPIVGGQRKTDPDKED